LDSSRLSSAVEADGEAAQAGGKARAHGDSLDRRGPTRGEGRVDQRLVFGLCHAIADDQLNLIEGWRTEHALSDSYFLTINMAFDGYRIANNV
jgi:hypothetical protein